MHKPLKIKLYLEDELPKEELFQRGGFIDGNLINNNKFKYLRADSTVETFIYGASKIVTDVKLWFEFKSEHNVITKDNSSYVDRTNNSVSFVITQLKKYSNVKVRNFKKDILNLKLIDLNHKTMDSYIQEWNENITIFHDSIIDIYMCGDLCTKDGKVICNYIITKKYENNFSLLKLDYSQTIKYIIKMMLFFGTCEENNIIFRDFKFSCIGYEFIDGEIQFIVLDYNDTTLLKKTDIFFDTFKDGCNAMCVGTLVPYFIIHDFFEMETNWKDKLDKLYSVGLAETLIFLLYEQDETMEKILKFIYNPSHLKPCLHYYHFMKLFDNETDKSIFYRLITTLKPKFVELEPEINQMFIRIIQNCFETKYKKVKTSNSYLEHINKIYSEHNKEKSNIKTFIEPIGKVSLNNRDTDNIQHARDIQQDIQQDIKQDIQQDIKQDIQQDIKQDIQQDIKQDIQQDMKQDIQQDMKQDIQQIQDMKQDMKQDIQQGARRETQNNTDNTYKSVLGSGTKEHKIKELQIVHSNPFGYSNVNSASTGKLKLPIFGYM
jgi:hypothetical protein